MDEKIFAHSANKDVEFQTLSEYSLNVAKLVSGFAKKFGSENWAYGIGLLHDLGKASAALLKVSQIKIMMKMAILSQKQIIQALWAIYAIKKYRQNYCILHSRASRRIG